MKIIRWIFSLSMDPSLRMCMIIRLWCRYRNRICFGCLGWSRRVWMRIIWIWLCIGLASLSWYSTRLCRCRSMERRIIYVRIRSGWTSSRTHRKEKCVIMLSDGIKLLIWIWLTPLLLSLYFFLRFVSAVLLLLLRVDRSIVG